MSIKEKNLKTQSAKLLADISLQFSRIAANGACCYIYHQPKMPDSVKKLRKF